jgi:pimeloyl-ACP methyl ester carboxylesterase
MCTFKEQVRTLAQAIATVSGSYGGRFPVAIVGHSIGGMLAFLLAAHGVAAQVIGAAASGIGVQFAAGVEGGWTAQFGDTDIVNFSNQERDSVMFASAEYIHPDVHHDARSDLNSFAMTEFACAEDWPQTIRMVAPKIQVPTLQVIPAMDGFWSATDQAKAASIAAMSGSYRPRVEVQHGAGHCLDAHRVGYSHHLAVAAFIEECLAESQAP